MLNVITNDDRNDEEKLTPHCLIFHVTERSVENGEKVEKRIP